MSGIQSDCIDRQVLTTGEVAALLHVNPGTVRGMCERGELEGAVRIGNWWRIPRGALKPYETPDGERGTGKRPDAEVSS